MKKIGISTFQMQQKYGDKRALEMAKATGVDAVDFNLLTGGYDCRDKSSLYGKGDEAVVEYFTEIKRYADWFGICVDTGHSNKAARFGNPSAADVIRMCGKDIIALHLNDNDGLTDQHKTPATGNIDWTDVFSALEQVGFSGVYNLELKLTHFGKNFEQEEAEFAVKVTRKLLTDFEESNNKGE